MKFFLCSITALLMFQLSLLGSDILILFTSDVHGNILSDDGGFLRISSAIKEEVKDYKKNQIILLDCGDAVTGTFDAAATKGEIIVKIMNLIGYEFWIPGNHEFDYGYDSYLKMITGFRGKTLVCNLQTGEKKGNTFPYAIINKNGYKVAIIGATFPDMNTSEIIAPSAPFKSVSISSGLNAVMPEILSKNPDLIVLAVHGGMFNKTWNISGELRKFPQIKLVLGGHTHQPIEGKMLYKGAYFVQPGHAGEFIGRVEITFAGENKKVQISSELLESGEYPPDQQLYNKIKEKLTDLNELKKSVIADIPNSKAQLAGILVSESMRNITGCDAAIFGLQYEPEILRGKITSGKIFQMVPHENTISKMRVNREELREILQDMYKHKKKKKKYKAVASCAITYKVSKKGIVTDVEFPKELDGKDRIDIAISSYYIEYPTIKFPAIREAALKTECGYVQTQFYVRDVFAEYLSLKFPPLN